MEALEPWLRAPVGLRRVSVSAVVSATGASMARVEFDDFRRGTVTQLATAENDVAAVFEAVRAFANVDAELEEFKAWSRPRDFSNASPLCCRAHVSILIAGISCPGYADAGDMMTACAMAFLDALERPSAACARKSSGDASQSDA